MNPKEIFLKELMAKVEEFESATGVHIKSVDFERFGTRDAGDISNKSVITAIQLNFA